MSLPAPPVEVTAPVAPAEPRIGSELRRRRLERHLTLEQAAAATRIRPRHLESLEAGELTSLPSGDIYVRGYVRAYARFLGLDPEIAVSNLPGREPASPPAGGLLSIGGFSPHPARRLMLTRPVLVGSALLAGSLLFLAYVGHQIDSARIDGNPGPVPAQSVPIASPPPATAPAPAPSAAGRS